ncbi:MAG TPA: UDP-N-acetylmuramoyl-L-alanyl-D-glutamate--2,6-diaminopimelate ligase [Syntrophomonadaceae bacterium]|nr:UDP-N-acetylmuramoyl-L-alanyl-D-glutamate--2,6-diaminopimelate ligase [Syntrophomonadaceae bacterium]
MKLSHLLKDINFDLLHGDLDLEIEGIAYDSRKVESNFLFICIKGFKTDGHNYIQEAINNGAIAVLVQDKGIELPKTSVIRVPDTRKVLAKVAANFYKYPSLNLNLIGVTGTNGKTTISHLIKAILEEAGQKVGILGTLYAKVGEVEKNIPHTTPEAPEIEEFLSLALEAKADHVVMEVSSHALDLNRVDCLKFNCVVYSNLSQEHLDYHKDMETYKNAKLKLFNMLGQEKDSFGIVNIDDVSADAFIEALAGKSITYAINKPADIRATEVITDYTGTSFTVSYNKKSFPIRLKILGIFNVYNTLAAIAFALKKGIEISLIQKALAKFPGVSGRFELVKVNKKFLVIVDYAHTPDGLENILKTASEITQNRLITVFGCGGDRDRTKRPLMGQIAASYSDFCVVTSDNPRTEDPQAIIDDIIPGLDMVKNSRYAIVIDRREAIKHTLFIAKEGDVVIIAGKGHETYQIIGDKTIDFDDRQVVQEVLRELG